MLSEGASTDSYSLVELCTRGRWESMCDHEWTTEDLAIVCHEAGYASHGRWHRYVLLCTCCG